MADCCLCNGPLILLGQLGQTKQWRCRHCGMIFSAVRSARGKEKHHHAPIAPKNNPLGRTKLAILEEF